MEIQMWLFWGCLTLVFIAGEMVKKESVFLWPGFGSSISCILALLSVPAAGQIAVFINISAILILLDRRFRERYRFKTARELSEGLAEDRLKKENRYVFKKNGPVWEIVFEKNSCTLKHSVGLIHIRNLIINNEKWITCSDLKNISSGLPDNKPDEYKNMSKEQLALENLYMAGNLPPEDIIDRISLDQIKKLRGLLHEKISAGGFDSPEEMMQGKSTLDFIEEYLKKNTNITGRSRKMPDRSETDRKAVSAAINRCRNNLKEHKELYAHLKSFIQARGDSFRYFPDRPIHWETD